MNKRKHKRLKKKTKKRLTPSTQNGIMIFNLMKDQKIKGNYKDYIILSPQGVIHWKGTFDLHRQDNGKKLDIPAIAILHKRDLRKILGPEIARLFWNHGRTLAKF